MVTLNDYLYSGDTMFKILKNYSQDLKKEAKCTGNEIDLMHANFLLQIRELLEHNDFLTAQSQKIREFYIHMAKEYPLLAFNFKGRIKSLIRAAASAFQACGEDVEFESAGSTDANIPISLGIPAICVGGGGKGGACHSVDEWYDSKDAYKGSQRVLAAIFALVGLDGVSEPLLSRRKK